MSDGYILDSNRIIHYHRWWLVSFIAVVMIFFSVFGLLAAIGELFAYSLPSFKDGFLSSYKENAVISGAVILQYMFYYIVFTLLLNLLKLIGAIQLNRRKNWARIFYVIYFLISALLGLLTVIGLGVSLYAGKQGLDETLKTQHLMTNMFGILAGVLGAGLIFDVVGIFALSSSRAREEFGN